MLTGLDHATIMTTRLAATRTFFVEGLGLEDGYRPDFGIGGHWLYLRGQAVLHLIEWPEARPPAGAIDHFAFATDDLDAATARLDHAGIEWARQDFPDGRGAQLFCRDPNGVQIEISWRG